METLLEVLKWVAIVFVAGVIGQFGKSLTLKILESRRRCASTRSTGGARDPAAPADTAPPASQDTPRASSDGPALPKEAARSEAKIAKKAEKAAVKRAKKQQDPGSSSHL